MSLLITLTRLPVDQFGETVVGRLEYQVPELLVLREMRSKQMIYTFSIIAMFVTSPSLCHGELSSISRRPLQSELGANCASARNLTERLLTRYQKFQLLHRSLVRLPTIVAKQPDYVKF